MSTFDAGSIEGRLDLDLSPFNRGLDDAEERARRFSASSYSARVEIDTARARVELEALQAKLRALGAGPGGTPTIKPKVDTSDVKRAAKDAKDATGQFSLMRTAIEQLLPAAVTLGGGVAGLGIGFAAMGIAGVAAFKAVTAEIKAGTPVGQAFGAQIGVVKGALVGLEGVAARSVLPGFTATVGELTAKLPQLTGLLNGSGHALGGVVSNAVGGLLGLLQQMSPVIRQAQGYVVSIAEKFNAWANGPGGAKFAAALSKDFQQLVPFLNNTVALVGKLIAGLNPIGGGTLGVLTNLIGLLDKLPTGAVTAFTTAYIAFRAAVTINNALGGAVKSLEAFSAAQLKAAAASKVAAAGEEEAAAAQLGMSGRLAAFTARALPVVGVLAGVAIGFSALTSATQSWQTSLDKNKSFLSNYSDFISSVFTLNINEAGNAISRMLSFNSRLDARNQDQASLNITNTGFTSDTARAQQLSAYTYAFQQQSNVVAGLTKQYYAQQSTVDGLNHKLQALNIAGKGNTIEFAKTNIEFQQQVGILNALTPQYQAAKDKLDGITTAIKHATTAQSALNAENARAISRGIRQYVNPILTQNRANDQSALATPDLSGASSNLGQYAQQLQATIAAEQKFTKVTDDNTVTLSNGLVVEKSVYDAQVKSTGSVRGAEIALESYAQAQRVNVAAQQQAILQQTRINQALGAAETKFHLTQAQVTLYAEAVGISASAVAHGSITQREFNLEIGKVKDVVATGGNALASFVQAESVFTSSTKSAGDVAGLLAQAMVSLNGDTLSVQGAVSTAAGSVQQFVTDFDNLRGKVFDAKTATIDYHNAAAGPLLSDLASMQSSAAAAAKSVYQNELALRGNKQAASDAAATYRNETNRALIDNRTQLGLTLPQAQKLAHTYFSWPKTAKTQIEQLGGHQTAQVLSGILQDLDKLSGGHHADLYFNDHGALTRVQQISAAIDGIGSVSLSSGLKIDNGIPKLVPGKAGGTARGTVPPNQVFTMGERGWELGMTDSQGRVAIVDHHTARTMTGLPAVLPGYANGTGPGGEHGKPTGIVGVYGSGGSTSSGPAAASGAVLASASTVLGQIERQVGDPRVRLAMATAPFLEGGGPTPLGSGGWGVGDYGTSFGPYQIHLPAHPGVTAAQATNPADAVRIMKGAYTSAVAGVPASLWASNPTLAAEQAAFAAERPSQNYYASHGASAVSSAYSSASQALAGAPGGSAGGASGSAATKVDPRTTKWYQIGQHYFRGLQSANQERAALSSRNSSGITQVGSGKFAGFGYDGQGYSSSYDALNAEATLKGQIGRASGSEADKLTKSSIYGLATGSSSTLTSRLSTIAATFQSARTAGIGPSSLLTQFERDNQHLDKLVAQRDRIAARVTRLKATLSSDRQAATQYRQQLTSTYTGSFNVGTAGGGSAYGILATLQQADKGTVYEEQLLARAKALGLDPRLIGQLRSQGLSGQANLEAIVQAGKGYVGQLNAAYGKFTGDAGAIGVQGEQAVYGKRLATDTAAVKEAQQAQLVVVKEMRGYLADVRRLLRELGRDVKASETKSNKRR